MTASRGERPLLIGAGALAVLVLVVGWFFLISPQRSETADVQSQTADAQTQNLTLQGRINSLAADSKNRGKYLAAMAAARAALPTRTDISPFLRSMQAIAAATSARVTSLNVGDPEAFTAAAAPGAAAASPSGSSTSAGDSAASAASAAPSASVFGIAIDASVVGRPAALSAFLTSLQTRQPRAVLVSTVDRSVDSGTSAVLQLKMTAFVASGATPAPSPSSGG